MPQPIKCLCYACRMANWEHKVRLRKRIGMKVLPPKPVKDPNQPVPCPCHSCAYRRQYMSRRRKTGRPRHTKMVNGRFAA